MAHNKTKIAQSWVDSCEGKTNIELLLSERNESSNGFSYLLELKTDSQIFDLYETFTEIDNPENREKENKHILKIAFNFLYTIANKDLRSLAIWEICEGWNGCTIVNTNIKHRQE